MNIVLFEPLIPQNTGAIGRLCVCNDFALHLIHPLGFSLDKKSIKRAGMDYWKYLKLYEHSSFKKFLQKESPKSLIFLSTRGEKKYFDYSFCSDDYIVFGNESYGLTAQIYKDYKERLYTIPMRGEKARSHNLANSVAIVTYEALRQIYYL